VPPLTNQKNKVYLLGGLVVLVIAAAALLSWYFKGKPSSSKIQKTVSETSSLPQETPQQPPTLSPEKIEIISKIETHTVEIANGQFNPPTLTIKAHDQVMWQNKDGKTHKITGENWGNVPIANGESFTQAFDTPGTYSYSCALYPEMKGTIIVK